MRTFSETQRTTDCPEAKEHQLARNHNSALALIDRLSLARAVRKLASGYKRLFLLHDVIGYQHNEIAALLGCSTGSSKSQLHKARKRLRQLLSGEKGQPEHEVPPVEAADAAVTEIGPKRHPDVTYRLNTIG